MEHVVADGGVRARIKDLRDVSVILRIVCQIVGRSGATPWIVTLAVLPVTKSRGW